MIALPSTVVELRASHWEGKPSQTPCRSMKGHSVSPSLSAVHRIILKWDDSSSVLLGTTLLSVDTTWQIVQLTVDGL